MTHLKSQIETGLKPEQALSELTMLLSFVAYRDCEWQKQFF